MTTENWNIFHHPRYLVSTAGNIHLLPIQQLYLEVAATDAFCMISCSAIYLRLSDRCNRSLSRQCTFKSQYYYFPMGKSVLVIIKVFHRIRKLLHTGTKEIITYRVLKKSLHAGYLIKAIYITFQVAPLSSDWYFLVCTKHPTAVQSISLCTVCTTIPVTPVSPVNSR